MAQKRRVLKLPIASTKKKLPNFGVGGPVCAWETCVFVSLFKICALKRHYSTQHAQCQRCCSEFIAKSPNETCCLDKNQMKRFVVPSIRPNETTCSQSSEMSRCARHKLTNWLGCPVKTRSLCNLCLLLVVPLFVCNESPIEQLFASIGRSGKSMELANLTDNAQYEKTA